MFPSDKSIIQSPVNRRDVLHSEIPNQLEEIRNTERIYQKEVNKMVLDCQSERLTEFSYTNKLYEPFLDRKLHYQQFLKNQFGENNFVFLIKELNIFPCDSFFIYALLEYMYLKTNKLNSILSEDHSDKIDLFSDRKEDLIININKINEFLLEIILPRLSDPIFMLALENDEKNKGEVARQFALNLEKSISSLSNVYEAGIELINESTHRISQRFKGLKKKGSKRSRLPLARKTKELLNQLNAATKIFLKFLEFVHEGKITFLDGWSKLEEIEPNLESRVLKVEEWKETINPLIKFIQILIQARFKQLKEQGNIAESRELMSSWIKLLSKIKRSEKSLASVKDGENKNLFLFSLVYPNSVIVFGRSLDMDLDKIEEFYEKMHREHVFPFPNFSDENLDDLINSHRCLRVIDKYIPMFSEILKTIYDITNDAFSLFKKDFPFEFLNELSISFDILSGNNEEIDEHIEEVHEILLSHFLYNELNMKKIIDLFTKSPLSTELTKVLACLKEIIDQRFKRTWLFSLPFFMEIFDWIKDQKINYEKSVDRFRNHLIEQLAKRQVPLSEDAIEDLQVIIELVTNVLGYPSLNLQIVLHCILEMDKRGNTRWQEEIYSIVMMEKINVYDILRAAEVKKGKERQKAEAVQKKTCAQKELVEQKERKQVIQGDETQDIFKKYPPRRKKEKDVESITAASKLRQILKRFQEIGFRKIRHKGGHIILKNGKYLTPIPCHGGGAHLSPGVVQNLNKILNKNRNY